jgi:hypothetical protein
VQTSAYLKEPQALVNFLLEAMRGHGVGMTGQVLEQMTQLFVHACKLYLKDQEDEGKEIVLGMTEHGMTEVVSAGGGSDVDAYPALFGKALRGMGAEDAADDEDHDEEDEDEDEDVLLMWVEQGEALVRDFALGQGRLGMDAVPPSEQILTALVELYCVAGLFGRARDLLESMEITYNVRPSAKAYYPVIQYNACVKYDWYEACTYWH